MITDQHCVKHSASCPNLRSQSAPKDFMRGQERFISTESDSSNDSGCCHSHSNQQPHNWHHYFATGSRNALLPTSLVFAMLFILSLPWLNIFSLCLSVYVVTAAVLAHNQHHTQIVAVRAAIEREKKNKQQLTLEQTAARLKVTLTQRSHSASSITRPKEQGAEKSHDGNTSSVQYIM